MHALVNAPLPAHDEKTDAVLLYSEKNVTVLSADKIKKTVRVPTRFCARRPRLWRGHSLLQSHRRSPACMAGASPPRAKTMRSRTRMPWNLPAQGRGQRVGFRCEGQASAHSGAGSRQHHRIRVRKGRTAPGFAGHLEFPAELPVRESHYSLQLPPGWEYKASWLNYPEAKPAPPGGNQWQWAVSDVKAFGRKTRCRRWREWRAR